MKRLISRVAKYVGTWFLASKGTLHDLMHRVTFGSKYAVRQLRQPSAESLYQLADMVSCMNDVKIEISK